MEKHRFKPVWYLPIAAILLLTLWELLLEKHVMSVFSDVASETYASVPIAVNLLSVSLLIALVVMVFSVVNLMGKLATARKSMYALNQYERLIDTANAPIFGIDSRGYVNEWNQTAEALTGYSKAEVMGKELVAEFITEDYKESVAEVLQKALGGEETANYEFPLYTKSGEQLYVLLNSTTRRDANGQIVGVVGVGQDITELKNIQHEIIQSSKLATLGEMATAVAHELNQPLNTIRFASSNLVDAVELGKLTPEILESKLGRIEDQVQRASSIIDHMRIFGRATADESPEPMYPDAAVSGALDLMGEQLRLANINVIRDFSDDKVQILGHSILLEQVVLNLLANARDQLRQDDSIENKEIRLAVGKHKGGMVQIEVSDTGGGVPEAVIGRIFEPFYTTKKIGEGTGLGLSLSYGIVRDMGGTLSVRNGEHGAAFIISLPLLEDLAA